MTDTPIFESVRLTHLIDPHVATNATQAERMPDRTPTHRKDGPPITPDRTPHPHAQQRKAPL